MYPNKSNHTPSQKASTPFRATDQLDPKFLSGELSPFSRSTLTVLPADKEGGFAILTLGLFGSKAHTAVSSVFSSRGDVRIDKVKSEAKKLCKDLNLSRVVGGITNSKHDFF